MKQEEIIQYQTAQELPLEIGCPVYCEDFRQRGRLVGFLKDGRAIIMIGNLEVYLSVKDIVRVPEDV